eukprot:TRINITY_DN5872_c0_g1_i1.p1 TRINITY_DN5872_c0_g1~~TRINITY_DN5872_c0_g1_i1.p1  ORF type:complete len:148 (-),score=23.63 TRINITY_DN5872_c0_g1_i1:83-526(-)
MAQELIDVVYEQANSVKKGGFVLLDGHPCKVVETAWSKPGKHGSAKISFIGLDIFTGKKVEGIAPSSHNVEVPVVTKYDAQLINIDDGYLTLLLDDGNTTHDVLLPGGELGSSLQQEFDEGLSLQVTVITALGKNAVCAFKEYKIRD